MVVGALAHCASLYSVCNLTAAQMHIQLSLIWELYKFKPGYDTIEATEIFYCTKKNKGIVDLSTVSRWFKKSYSGCKNVNNQATAGKPKTVDPEVMLQTTEVNSTQRVSGELGILQSSVVCHLHDLGKRIRSCLTVPHITKILQNSWLNLVLVNKWHKINQLKIIRQQ